MLEATDGGWVVQGRGPLDQAVTALLEKSFAHPLKARSVGTQPNAKDYGLQDGALSVILYGEDTLELDLGKVHDKRVTYVRSTSPNGIFRVPANLKEIFVRASTDWVEKTLFTTTLQSVREVNLEVLGALKWRVERQSDSARWIMDYPRGLEAGQLDVDAMVGSLVGARATVFKPKQNFEVKSQLTFRTANDELFALRMSAPDQRGGLYVQAMKGTTQGFEPLRKVAYVPRHIAIFLQPTARDLRDRVVFPVRPNEVASLVISGRPEFRAEHNNGVWAVSIDHSPISGQRHLIEGWVESVIGLKSTGFVDREAPGAFDTLSGQITLRLKNDRMIQLEVGERYGRGRYARTSDRPQRVFILSESALNGLRPRAEFFSQPQGP